MSPDYYISLFRSLIERLERRISLIGAEHLYLDHVKPRTIIPLLICGQVSPELAFCSEECRSLVINRTRRASEPSPSTIALIRSLSDMCELLPFPEAIDFDRWIAETEDQKPKPYNLYNVNVDHQARCQSKLFMNLNNTNVLSIRLVG
jgi:predicted nucleic acid-binding Zn ribbon protein